MDPRFADTQLGNGGSKGVHFKSEERNVCRKVSDIVDGAGSNPGHALDTSFVTFVLYPSEKGMTATDGTGKSYSHWQWPTTGHFKRPKNAKLYNDIRCLR
jgi:hypothetical protein